MAQPLCLFLIQAAGLGFGFALVLDLDFEIEAAFDFKSFVLAFVFVRFGPVSKSGVSRRFSP